KFKLIRFSATYFWLEHCTFTNDIEFSPILKLRCYDADTLFEENSFAFGSNSTVSSVLTIKPALLRPFADFRMGITTKDLPIFVEKVICLVGGNNDTSEKCSTDKNNTDKYHLNHSGTIEMCKLLASRS
uniref:Uncharacterized protein n=1 Tax=Romanomermis culicivorax TaxID=13658 RepID=A0A915KUS6_ROMCU